MPGQGFIVLKRHCEDVGALTAEEAATLGEVMRRAAVAFTQVLAPERVHFGLYAEEVRHVHLHVLPRTRDLPAGNIPNHSPRGLVRPAQAPPPASGVQR